MPVSSPSSPGPSSLTLSARHIDRQTHTQTPRQTDRQTNTETDRHIHTDRHTDRQIDNQTYLSSFGLPSVTMTLNCFVSAALKRSAATTREVPWTKTVLPSCKKIVINHKN